MSIHPPHAARNLGRGAGRLGRTGPGENNPCFNPPAIVQPSRRPLLQERPARRRQSQRVADQPNTPTRSTPFIAGVNIQELDLKTRPWAWAACPTKTASWQLDASCMHGPHQTRRRRGRDRRHRHALRWWPRRSGAHRPHLLAGDDARKFALKRASRSRTCSPRKKRQPGCAGIEAQPARQLVSKATATSDPPATPAPST